MMQAFSKSMRGLSKLIGAFSNPRRVPSKPMRALSNPKPVDPAQIGGSRSITISTGVIALLALLAASTAWAHGISEADRQAMLEGGYLQFMRLGASHMLTGYDHLLFLFGVVFFLDNFRDVTKFITAFTVGHSITLIFATFLGITANYYLIDAVIALTVVYKGFDNLDGFRKLLNRPSPNLLLLVFIFGLIHGFGLSTRLQQLPLGESGLLLKILSFNVGVEIGQIAALMVMIVLLKAWRGRKSFQQFSTVSNIGLVLAGLALFVFQLSGYASERGEGSGHVATELSPADAAEVDWTDETTITVPARSSLEYKFQVEEGEVLTYSWQTDRAELYFDFHADPSGGGKFQSFEKATLEESNGSLTLPFTGSVGWYWKNNTGQPIEVTLRTQGNYEVLGVL